MKVILLQNTMLNVEEIKYIKREGNILYVFFKGMEDDWLTFEYPSEDKCVETYAMLFKLLGF